MSRGLYNGASPQLVLSVSVTSPSFQQLLNKGDVDFAGSGWNDCFVHVLFYLNFLPFRELYT